MSSVYIKGMEMPKHWRDCVFSNGAAQCCLLNMESCGNGIPCPLVPVPDHGRLVDADALVDRYGDWYTEEGTEEGFIGALKYLLYDAPTIIPEDKKDPEP